MSIRYIKPGRRSRLDTREAIHCKRTNQLIDRSTTTGTMMLKLALISILVIVSLIVSAIDCSSSGEWLAYKAKHGKSYASQVEDTMRHSVFLKNKMRIEQFNAEESKAVGFEKGINQFSDWTEEELANYQGGVAVPENWSGEHVNTPEAEAYLAGVLGNGSSPGLTQFRASSGPFRVATEHRWARFQPPSQRLPTELSINTHQKYQTCSPTTNVTHCDWRSIPGRVDLSVKDQGGCSASWAFAMTGLLEGQEAKELRGVPFTPLSAQNVLDCGADYGCLGMWPYYAMLILNFKKNGVDSEASYPYVANSYSYVGQCAFKPESAVILLSGPVALSNDEWELRNTVERYGPVAATIDLQDDLFAYKQGIYQSSNCVSDMMISKRTLGVLIVGYGVDKDNREYWILKNVLGSSWGEEGYFRLARGKNMCGIASLAYIAAF